MAAVYASGPDGLIVRAPEGSKGQGSYVDGPRKSFAGGAGLTSTAHDYALFVVALMNGVGLKLYLSLYVAQRQSFKSM